MGAQATEKWHSGVQIPGWTWVSQFREAVNLFLLGIGLSLKNMSKNGEYSSFVFPWSSPYHFNILPVNLSIVMSQCTSKENKIQKEAGRGPPTKSLLLVILVNIFVASAKRSHLFLLGSRKLVCIVDIISISLEKQKKCSVYF